MVVFEALSNKPIENIANMRGGGECNNAADMTSDLQELELSTYVHSEYVLSTRQSCIVSVE